MKKYIYRLTDKYYFMKNTKIKMMASQGEPCALKAAGLYKLIKPEVINEKGGSEPNLS